MKVNVGPFDGITRTLFFVIAIIFSIMTGQWFWLIPGVFLFATAVLMWCPVYALFGINSDKAGAGQ
jgi:hypothetical protein